MLGEVTHLQTISEDLKALTSDPHKLPPASEQVRKNIKDKVLIYYVCHIFVLFIKLNFCLLLFFLNSEKIS